jgi:adenine-specific DNA-methyltransferase
MGRKKNQKLELTWIGKGEEPKLEPRILVENCDYSCGDPNSGNMLIHGDNLLALKALEQEFSGSLKCIYIDPPFNTGAAFDNYDDGIEHSIWLDLMYKRIKSLYTLLSKSGCIFIHLDDNESDYCKIILDEIFGRHNFINRITIDARSPSAFSTVNPGVFKASEYILWYAKDKKKWESRSMRISSSRDTAYNKFIRNRDQDFKEWEILPLKQAFLENLNQEKVPTLKTYIEDIFTAKSELLDKKKVLQYLQSSFPFEQLIDIGKLANYLHSKLKGEAIYDGFYNKVYPYLLEKSSYNFNNKELDTFVFENSHSVFRDTEISDSGAGKETVDLKYNSIAEPDVIHMLAREGELDDIYILNGKQISFYSKNVVEIDGHLTATKLLTNIWADISWEGIAKEGGVTFKKGKKPERLIQRCFSLTTNEGDYVFDSFLGSGTTAAVAHKMKRKWIGVELGTQATTHCHPRLKKIVDGKDNTGISKTVNWQGGGGFKFYNLATSLLNQDKYGNWIISKEYNPAMLAAAMAKQEGFRYQPDMHVYWKQGISSEKDYIYTTTQFITVEILDRIHDEMKPDESLLITCKAFHASCEGRKTNITIKKIPHMLLGKCEFGKDDYSLNIVNMPLDNQIEADDEKDMSNHIITDNKSTQKNLFD